MELPVSKEKTTAAAFSRSRQIQISASGPWASHIAGVKSTFAAVPARDEAVTEEEQMALESVTEPSADNPVKLSSIEMPCWKRCSGWHGNQ